MITQEEYNHWSQDPTTNLYRKFLTKLRNDIKEGWASGIYTTEHKEGTLQLNSEQLGKVRLLQYLIDEVNYSEIVEVINDD